MIIGKPVDKSLVFQQDQSFAHGHPRDAETFCQLFLCHFSSGGNLTAKDRLTDRLDDTSLFFLGSECLHMGRSFL